MHSVHYNLNYKVIQLQVLPLLYIPLFSLFFQSFVCFSPIKSFCFSSLQLFGLYVCAHYQDCFSMTNVSWYGGASVRGQTWPINDQNATMQPFTVSDLKDNPSGFGSALERYFLGSSGRRSLWEWALLSAVSGGCLISKSRVTDSLHTQVCRGKKDLFKSLNWHTVSCFFPHLPLVQG